jgi:hypothetical protein
MSRRCATSEVRPGVRPSATAGQARRVHQRGRRHGSRLDWCCGSSVECSNLRQESLTIRLYHVIRLMLRKLLAAISLGATVIGTSAAPPYSPYQSESANDIYNLLFCDNLGAFKPGPGQEPVPWQVSLFSEPAEAAALLALAADSAQEGRIRYLAYARLRAIGQTVPARVLLGVIVEVPLSGGLDVLAAFSEGGVRYINKTGKLAVIESVAALQPRVQSLMEASGAVVARIGPWEQPRRAPPRSGNVRLTFLVSDGLYFGEGPMSVMQREPLAGPVIQRATELLQTVVPLATK